MQKQKMSVVVCLAGIAISGGALADNCNGTYHNVGHTADTQDIGADVKLTAFTGFTSAVWNERKEQTVGSCAGYALALPEGKARVVYACVRKNAAGDVYVDEGSWEPGAEMGTWKITAGTGSFIKTIGNGGWWKPVMDNGKVVSGMWGGNCR